MDLAVDADQDAVWDKVADKDAAWDKGKAAGAVWEDVMDRGALPARMTSRKSLVWEGPRPSSPWPRCRNLLAAASGG